MAPTEGRVAKPERRWGCLRGTPRATWEGSVGAVACPEVIYVRPTVNTVFIDKHCRSSVLSFPSFVRTADSFTSFRSQLKTYMFARHL